ncbi:MULTISPECIES: helix-turn-helix transcriptional regulator [unclassified Neorhizobium]|uniref:helix-turn-helix transcriptional regulator n=1 Tax=unclassified Neorhizobium TaxID=2629175 RepID=UPI001FF3091B|nr:MULTISPECIES: helix-turn-helix domain-containing protein [unclassified Neorhizobium]MCJ9673054.1 helix-turn-helix domain-containing protein [Neorhizobium sp. SHOUNA12B]MCJ9748564.1 helix-turn-helix domain-containing protein [Neorhizobium sp. SHOUNA12A]
MLGKLIRIGRAERGLTAQELADRAGISRTTLSSIEKGAPGPEIGTVFEVVSLVGLRLFESDERMLQVYNFRLDEKLTLLPKSVRHAVKEVDDDF